MMIIHEAQTGANLTNRSAQKGLHSQTDAHVNRGSHDGAQMLLQGSSLLLETSWSGQGSDWAGALWCHCDDSSYL